MKGAQYTLTSAQLGAMAADCAKEESDKEAKIQEFERLLKEYDVASERAVRANERQVPWPIYMELETKENKARTKLIQFVSNSLG